MICGTHVHKVIFVAVLSGTLMLPAAAGDQRLTAKEQAQIYARVIQSLLGLDPTYDGQPIEPGKVYIDEKLGTPLSITDIKDVISFDEKLHSVSAGPPPPPPPLPPVYHGYSSGTEPSPVMMPAEARSALIKILRLPQFELHWISDELHGPETPMNKQAVVGESVSLSFSNTAFLSADTLYVEGEIDASRMVPSSTFYFFKKDKSGWHLSRKIDEYVP